MKEQEPMIKPSLERSDQQFSPEKAGNKEVGQKLIERVEALNLNVNHKQEIILVAANIKPSAWIDFETRMWHEGEAPTTFYTENEIESFYNVIRESGLFYKISPRKAIVEEQKMQGEKVKVHRDMVEVLIANSDDKLQILSRVLEGGKLDHETLGRILGIPETAVEAFTGKRKRLNPYILSKEILISDAFLFSPTRVFSEDNWREEMIEGERRANILKQVSPEIYREVREESLKNLDRLGLLQDKTRKKWAKKIF